MVDLAVEEALIHMTDMQLFGNLLLVTIIAGGFGFVFGYVAGQP